MCCVWYRSSSTSSCRIRRPWDSTRTTVNTTPSHYHTSHPSCSQRRATHLSSSSDTALSVLGWCTEARGDTEIEVTPWEDVNQGIGATRSIRFIANLEVRGHRPTLLFSPFFSPLHRGHAEHPIHRQVGGHNPTGLFCVTK